MKNRNILLAVIGAIIAIAITGFVIWNKPHEKVESVKGVVVPADKLVKAYIEDEKAANALYLNKALQVTGVVSEIDQNQDGGQMVVLETGDPIAAVQCTLREKNIKLEKGKTITLKGFCTGNSITGVTLTDCIVLP